MKVLICFLMSLLVGLCTATTANAQCNGSWERMTSTQNPMQPESSSKEASASDSQAPWPMQDISSCTDYCNARVDATGIWVTGSNNLSTGMVSRSADVDADGLYIEVWEYSSTDGSQGFASAAGSTLGKGRIKAEGNTTSVHAMKAQVVCTLHGTVKSEKEYQLVTGSSTPVSVNLSKWGIGINVPVIMPGAPTDQSWEAPADFDFGHACIDSVILKDRCFGKALGQGGGISVPATWSKLEGMFHGKATSTLVLSQCCNQVPYDPVCHGPGTTTTPATPSTPGATTPHVPPPYPPPATTPPGGTIPTPAPPKPHGPTTPGGQCPPLCPLHPLPALSLRGT